MTASIVARDPRTGELGVGVFSAYPSVGMRVAFAAPGIGAIATQARGERSYGPRGLQMLSEGVDASTVVERLVADDADSAGRQVAVLSAGGDMAGFTGDLCVPYFGEASAADCRCQANMMAGEAIPETMCAAFEAAEGALAVRVLTALEAGQAAGGDARGRMSAGLLVVPAEGEPWRSLVDVRVDHHDDPLPELRRALDFNRAFDLLAVAGERGRAGDGDGAMQASLEALQLAPDNPQLLLWMGLGAAEGNLEVGVNLVRRALELQPSLGDFLARLPATAMPSAPAVREQL